MRNLTRPIRRIIVTDTKDGESCRRRSECNRRVKSLQNYHQNELELADISYNFLIGDDGFVYEGRGYGLQPDMLNNTSASSFEDIGLIVAFIGNFNELELSASQIVTFNEFIRQSDAEDLDVSYTLLLENQLVMREEIDRGLFNMLAGKNEFHQMQHITSRNQWGALPATSKAELPLPIEDIVLYILVPYDCSTIDLCKESLRQIQEEDFGFGYNDIIFNFIIGKPGIFEGRSWDTITQDLRFPNELSIGIFSDNPNNFDEIIREFLDGLIYDGKMLEKLSPGVTIRCLQNVDCT